MLMLAQNLGMVPGLEREPQAGTGLRATGRSSLGRFTTPEITDSPIAIRHTSWYEPVRPQGQPPGQPPYKLPRRSEKKTNPDNMARRSPPKIPGTTPLVV